MKKIKHKDFLIQNNLEISRLPKPLMISISLFDRMNRQLPNVKDEGERKKLLSKLQKLDMEILRELIEEFQHKLNNNELGNDPIKPLTDDQIIERLYKQKKYKLTRSELYGHGLKARLSKPQHQIGGYLLIKTTRFFYTYRITKIKKG